MLIAWLSLTTIRLDSTEPSQEDIQTTKQLVAAGNLIGVQILDHLIVTYRKVSSIRESHPHLFKEEP